MTTTLDFWFDFGCPYSRMSLVELQRVINEGASDLEVSLRALRLDPDAPVEYGKTTVENLCDHLGITATEALAMLQSVVDTGKSVNVEFDFLRARGASTRDAHRVLKLAARHGAHLTFAEAVFTAHFEKGLLISDHEVLRTIAASLALPGSDVDEVLAGNMFGPEVAADEGDARRLGIVRTPHFRFDNGVNASGQLTRADFLRVMSGE